MQSSATTVKEYLASLPDDRRAAINAVRDVILKNLDPAYEEGMQYGMIGYYVPHRLFPPGYHCDPTKPLQLAALASQKNHMALYLMAVYCGCLPGEEGSDNDYGNWFQKAWRDTGKKLDMGKACIRFKKLDDVALDVIGEAIKRLPVKKWIEIYTSALASINKNKAPARKAKTVNAKIEKSSVKKASRK